MANGCGPYWCPKWMRDSLTYFEEECNCHDRDYTEAVMSQKECDEEFLRRMLDKAGDNRWRRGQAYFFYRMVRVGGRLSYGSKK